jgi:hypothetical protein
VVSRRARSSLGCLFSLLIVAAAVYFGINFAEVYWRFYEFQDAMKQEVRFARQVSDERIRLRLVALVDSLGLPEEASDVTVNRTSSGISVSAEYTEHVELPGVTRSIRFRPHAEGTF